MYNYIPHPSNCRVSSSVLRLLAKEGAAGYGIYWMLLEMLRDAPGYCIEYSPEVLAYSLHLSSTDILTRVCEQYGLFTITKDGKISSSWLCSAMEEYDERKAKLREAGKRGAAHRWGNSSGNDGQTMATPSQDDGQTIAPNTTLFNVSQRNITLPDTSGSRRVGVEYLELLCSTQQEGHAPGYVAQVCMQYGCTEATCDFICEQSNNAETTHPTFVKFKTIVGRIQREKWVPNHPDGFFLKKLFE